MRLLEEALSSGLPVSPILYAPERLASTAQGRALRRRLEHSAEAEEIAEPLLKSLTDTVFSQGVVAAAALPAARPVAEEGLALVLDGIADPGNAGSMLRTARAAGVGTVVATQATTDLWSPKAVRAGMGAHFHLNLLLDVPWREMPLAIGQRRLLVADAREGDPYWSVDWTRAAALVIGSEARGPATDLPAADRVTIPMAPGTESLNAAASAAILLFAARRAVEAQ